MITAFVILLIINSRNAAVHQQILAALWTHIHPWTLGPRGVIIYTRLGKCALPVVCLITCFNRAASKCCHHPYHSVSLCLSPLPFQSGLCFGFKRQSLHGMWTQECPGFLNVFTAEPLSCFSNDRSSFRPLSKVLLSRFLCFQILHFFFRTAVFGWLFFILLCQKVQSGPYSKYTHTIEQICIYRALQFSECIAQPSSWRDFPAEHCAAVFPLRRDAFA